MGTAASYACADDTTDITGALPAATTVTLTNSFTLAADNMLTDAKNYQIANTKTLTGTAKGLDGKTVSGAGTVAVTDGSADATAKAADLSNITSTAASYACADD